MLASKRNWTAAAWIRSIERRLRHFYSADILEDSSTTPKVLATRDETKKSLDAIEVTQILESALRLALVQTGATAGAIALSHQGPMVCCATLGEIAPPLGAPVDSAAGITGTCVRTGRVLRCDNPQLDAQVNSSLCRRLGIGSILVLPIKDSRVPVGVMELLSREANAFHNIPPALLLRLLDLAEAIQELVSGRESATAGGQSPDVEQQSLNDQRLPIDSVGSSETNLPAPPIAEVQEIIQDSLATWGNMSERLASYLDDGSPRNPAA